MQDQTLLFNLAETPTLNVTQRVRDARNATLTNAERLEIYFDGGCVPNPGERYGSFDVIRNGERIAGRNRVGFGRGSNNEAEWLACILALNETAAWCDGNGLRRDLFWLDVFTDAEIVRYRLMVRNRIIKKYESSKRMFALANEALAVLRTFRTFSVTWRGRDANVERFGH